MPNTSTYCHQFLVSGELGGAGLIGLHLSKWVARRGVRARIWLPEEGPAAAAARQEGLCWQRYPLKAMTRGVLRHSLVCLRMLPGLRCRPGLAHVHTPAAFRMIRPALRCARLPVVVHLHLEPMAEEVRWAFRDPPELVITCARFMVRLLREGLAERGERLRVVPVPNAVNTDLYFPGSRPAAKQQVNAPADRPLLLMLANLAPHKGQETALRAVAELKGRGRAVECWLAGVERDGGREYQQYLYTLAHGLGIGDRVRFLGFRKDVPELLRAADFLLLPSTREGLPLSILEAQASKTVVLATPTAGIPEVVRDGETGFLIPAGDALGYADRLQLLADNPDLYQRLTQRAYDVVRTENNWPTYCERIGELYRDLVEAGNRKHLVPR